MCLVGSMPLEAETEQEKKVRMLVQGKCPSYFNRAVRH